MKPISGNTNYLISEEGKVFSVRKRGFLNDFLSGKKKRALNETNNTYRAVNIFINGKTKHYVHRLVAIAFIPNPDNLPQVNHKDGDHDNNHVSNLEWADNSKNQQHAFLNKLQKSGEQRRRSSLTNAEAETIRNLNKSGMTQYKLSKLFKVNTGTVHGVVHGKTYKEYNYQ